MLLVSLPYINGHKINICYANVVIPGNIEQQKFVEKTLMAVMYAAACKRYGVYTCS